MTDTTKHIIWFLSFLSKTCHCPIYLLSSLCCA